MKIQWNLRQQIPALAPNVCLTDYFFQEPVEMLNKAQQTNRMFRCHCIVHFAEADIHHS